MTVAALRTTTRALASSMQPKVLAIWRAQPGAFMLLGQSTMPMPKSGSARMTTLPGVFRAEFWQLANEEGYAFLAAIRLPQAADRTNAAELTVRGSRGADRDFRLTMVDSCDEAEFGQQVGSLAGSYAARLTHFMLDVMQPDDGSDTYQPRALISSFLSHAAHKDGCVELLMHVPKRCVVLQGWGSKLSDPVELLLPSAYVLRHPASSGDFARGDLTAPMTGSVLALPHDAIGAINGLEAIYLLTPDRLFCRHVMQPNVIDFDASIGQIRHLLPQLNCPASLQALLRTTLQPDFSGRDTLNSAGRPVRAALDMSVAAGGQVYLSGWVFDPAGHVTELYLCNDRLTVRLDDDWVRVPRQDVSSAFAADPAFRTPLSHNWGFAISTHATLSPDRPAYLQFSFGDGDLAFMPINFVSPDAPAVLTALLASVDLHKASGLSIIERHLAPFVAGLPSASDVAGQILLRGPLDRARSIVVALRNGSLPRSFVSSFLLDPAKTGEQIVFVCGPEWSQAQLSALIGLIRFYVLPASIVTIAQTPLPAHAVLEAAAISRSEEFLLVSPTVVGSASGWRDELRRAAATDSVVCPTVLFEDHSVRFAGSKRILFHGEAPFLSVYAPLAGAYADIAEQSEPARVDNGTLTCCSVRRDALPAFKQATRFTTEAGQETALFLSLREAGLHTTWVCSVRVYAPEEDPAQDIPVSSLIDSWNLRQTWKGAPV